MEKYIKVKKKFNYKGIELKIVEREEPYMNAKETVTSIRVIAPNGGTIPLQLKRKQTLKSIIEETIILLDSFQANGADVEKELTKEI